jgi:hypothetical protein
MDGELHGCTKGRTGVGENEGEIKSGRRGEEGRNEDRNK